MGALLTLARRLKERGDRDGLERWLEYEISRGTGVERHEDRVSWLKSDLATVLITRFDAGEAPRSDAEEGLRLLLGLAEGGWTDASGDLNDWHDQWGNAEVARFWLRKLALASPEIAAEFDDPSLTAPEETPEEEDASARAMLDLGLDLIEMGQTDDGDRFVRQAAEKGSVSAQHRLGKRLAERGDDEGERWLQRAAEQGSGDAAADLAAILLQRGGSEEAESRWRSAAEQGDGAAAYILGLLRDGRGDGADALQWFRLAVGHGSTPAAYRLSTMAPEPAGDDERSLRLAAEQGDAKAANNLGVTLDQRGEMEEAERWYRKAAEQGYAEAANNLGVCLEQRQEMQEAERWYRVAAEQGHAQAAGNLGVCLCNRGETADGESWLRRSASQGFAVAMRNLAFFAYARGEMDEARRLLTEAVAMGDSPPPEALEALGMS